MRWYFLDIVLLCPQMSDRILRSETKSKESKKPDEQKKNDGAGGGKKADKQSKNPGGNIEKPQPKE